MATMSSSCSVNTQLSFNEIKTLVHDILEKHGKITITDSGIISINSIKITSFATSISISGKILKYDDNLYKVSLDYSTSPDAIAWIIAVCLFPIGLLALIFANNAMRELTKKMDTALSEVEFIINTKSNNQKTIATTAPSPSTSSNINTVENANDPFEKMKKLQELKESGIISEEEFNQKKAKIMESI